MAEERLAVPRRPDGRPPPVRHAPVAPAVPVTTPCSPADVLRVQRVAGNRAAVQLVADHDQRRRLVQRVSDEELEQLKFHIHHLAQRFRDEGKQRAVDEIIAATSGIDTLARALKEAEAMLWDRLRPTPTPATRPSTVYDALVAAIVTNPTFEQNFSMHVKPEALKAQMEAVELSLIEDIKLPPDEQAHIDAIKDKKARVQAKRERQRAQFTVEAGQTAWEFVEGQFQQGITACGESSWNLSQLLLGLDYAAQAEKTPFASFQALFMKPNPPGRSTEASAALPVMHGRSIGELEAALRRTTGPQVVRILLGAPYGHGYVLEQFTRTAKGDPVMGRVYQSNIAPSLPDPFSLGDWLKDEKGKRTVDLLAHVAALATLVSSSSRTVQRRLYEELYMLSGTALADEKRATEAVKEAAAAFAQFGIDVGLADLAAYPNVPLSEFKALASIVTGDDEAMLAKLRPAELDGVGDDRRAALKADASAAATALHQAGFTKRLSQLQPMRLKSDPFYLPTVLAARLGASAGPWIKGAETLMRKEGDIPDAVTFQFAAAPFDPRQASASIQANLGG